MAYRARSLLDGRLYFEGGGADVLEAEVLHGRFGAGHELTQPPDLGGLLRLDLRGSQHPRLPDLHVAIHELFLAEVLQPLRLDEGEPASRGAVGEPRPPLVRAPWQVGAQAQLLAMGPEKEERLGLRVGERLMVERRSRQEICIVLLPSMMLRKAFDKT